MMRATMAPLLRLGQQASIAPFRSPRLAARPGRARLIALKWKFTRGARLFSSAATEATVERPTPLQLRRLFVTSAVPFIAFGIVDQSVLIYAGDAIDNTVGVWLGLPTLAAAAFGQVFSDASGVAFGGTIEALAMRLGLPLPGLSPAQMKLGIVSRISTLGGLCGVVTGCLIGMCNLLIIDLAAAERAKKAKELQTIMNTVVADGREVLGCQRATLWIVDEERGELWSTVADGVETQLRTPLKADQSIAAWVAINKEMANITDVECDPRWQRKEPPGDFKPRTMLCMPIVHDDKCIAVLQVLNKIENGEVVPFNAFADEKIIKMLAGHVAIFMDQLS